MCCVLLLDINDIISSNIHIPWIRSPRSQGRRSGSNKVQVHHGETLKHFCVVASPGLWCTRIWNTGECKGSTKSTSYINRVVQVLTVCWSILPFWAKSIGLPFMSFTSITLNLSLFTIQHTTCCWIERSWFSVVKFAWEWEMKWDFECLSPLFTTLKV